MRRIGALLAAALLAGCSHQRVGPPPPSRGPYLVDAEDAAFDGPYDILEAFVEELNGSLVVMINFRNFTAKDGNLTLPKVEARVELEREGRRWFYAGNKANLSKPAPHLSWVMGRWNVDAHEEIAEICTENTVRAPEPPYFIRLELLHEYTGFETGRGTLHGLVVESADFEGASYDVAESRSAVAIRGGPNPHDTCPLVAERAR